MHSQWWFTKFEQRTTTLSLSTQLSEYTVTVDSVLHSQVSQRPPHFSHYFNFTNYEAYFSNKPVISPTNYLPHSCSLLADKK